MAYSMSNPDGITYDTPAADTPADPGDVRFGGYINNPDNPDDEPDHPYLEKHAMPGDHGYNPDDEPEVDVDGSDVPAVAPEPVTYDEPQDEAPRRTIRWANVTVGKDKDNKPIVYREDVSVLDYMRRRYIDEGVPMPSKYSLRSRRLLAELERSNPRIEHLAVA